MAPWDLAARMWLIRLAYLANSYRRYLYALAALALLAWVGAAYRLRGVALALWLAVPPLVCAAAFCLLREGRPFVRSRWAKRTVFLLSEGAGVSRLDLVGLACAAAGVALAAGLVWWRLRAWRRVPAASLVYRGSLVVRGLR